MKGLCFHPDFMSSLDRPRAPGGMIAPLSIILTVFAAILVSTVASIEVVTTATGRIIPSSKVKTIRASESGLISKLYVHNGQQVKAGDLLIEIDDRSIRSEYRSLLTELDDVRSRLTLLETVTTLDFSSLRDWPTSSLKNWLLKTEDISDLHQQWLLKRLVNIKDKLAGQDREIAELKAERRIIAMKEDKMARIEPLIRERLEANINLAKKGYTSGVERQQEEINWHEAHFTAREHHLNLDLLDVRINSLEQKGVETYRQFQLDIANERQSLDLQHQSLRERKTGLEASMDNTRITTPITGIIEDLNVTTDGIYIGTGDTLMLIVPANDTPIAEVRIPSKEIGFLRLGQRARIKVDAFPFTRYGSLPAELIYLSHDATSSEDGTELAYTGHLKIDQPIFSTNGVEQAVQIGMSLQGDIITDKRTLIDFFISPIKETFAEAMRER